MRCFISIDIPEKVCRDIDELQNLIGNQNAFNGKLVENENLHITLKFLGDKDQDILINIKDYLKKVEQKEFNVGLEGIGAFPSKEHVRNIWIGIKEGREKLLSLQKKIDSELDKMEIKKEKREYTPKITLARIKQVTNKQELNNIFIKNLDRNFGYFKVREFKLKMSKLTPQGPIYEDVAVFGLSD